MALRRARTGQHAGREFRGCSTFAKRKCGGIREVEWPPWRFSGGLRESCEGDSHACLVEINQRISTTGAVAFGYWGAAVA
jgi:hypothetical protein